VWDSGAVVLDLLGVKATPVLGGMVYRAGLSLATRGIHTISPVWRNENHVR